jgi:LmbE family N-acetylglucosaminyl deacetylase
MFTKAKKILIVCAHADDMELGCGGTVNKLLEAGKDVYQLILSFNLKGTASKFTADDIRQEVYQSAKILGLKKQNIFMEKYENRVFPSYRQPILDTLWNYRRKINPDVVFTMSLDDMHQDHVTVAQESFRAFKECNLLSYGYDWNRLNKTADFYSVLSQKNLDRKIKAVSCYKSQGEGRPYFSVEYIKSWAITRGVEIKERYAESFDVIRLISQ